MEWKPVPGFPHLEASDSGLVRSLDHTVTNPRVDRWGNAGTITHHIIGRVLKPIKQKSGHLNVTVRAPEGYAHKQRPVGIHRLVCLAFHGEPPEGKSMACHKDDDPSNNVPDNLYWGSAADNAKDCTDNGNRRRGATHPNVSLTEAQIAEIRSRYKPKSKEHGSFALGKEFGVHRTTIENIVRGTTWADGGGVQSVASQSLGSL